MSQRETRPYGIAPPRFALPEATHVGAVHLQVNDLERSIDYYERVIGLRVHAGQGTAAALAPHGDDRVLVWLHEQRGVSPAPPRGAFGLYHFAVLLPDRAALGRFATHLSTLRARVGTANHLVSESFYLTDPDGLGIEVYADRPRETWMFDGRELRMSTEPLDVRDVAAAAGGTPWSGAPSGTRMGHVHLHVGTLPEAEAFYHAALGLDKTVWSYPGALFLSAGGYHHHLGTNTWSPGPSARDEQARLLEWELVVPTDDDAAAAALSLREAGYAVANARSQHDWSAKDPWGTQVRIAVGGR